MEEYREPARVVHPWTLLKGLVRSLRPRQWTKNLIVFIAPFFTVGEAWRPNELEDVVTVFGKTALAFLIFSVLSGSVYLVNDIMDVERDRAHPRKRFRPIASGELPIPVAWAAGLTLSAGGLALAFLLERLFGWVALTYLVTMSAYTMWLKQMVLLDVFAIAAGFILRAVAGAAVLLVPISPWLYIMTGLGALFIALAKRRGELMVSGQRATTQRETLRHYTPAFLDQLLGIVATSTLLAYTLYTFTAPNLPKNHAMMLTIPFVLYGLFRYLYLVNIHNQGENPEDIIISDVPLVLAILMWLATATVILVLFRG